MSKAERTLYVSWGGTGRAGGFRAAVRSLGDGDALLTYLGVLDQHSFGDIDERMIDLLKDELRWLLEAQIRLARRQLGVEDLEIDIRVELGDVVEATALVASDINASQVIIGASGEVASHASVETLRSEIASRTGLPATMVESADPPSV